MGGAALYYNSTPFENMTEMSLFRSITVQLIFGNAIAPIRNEVERFERGVLMKGWHAPLLFQRVGVHVRDMEGACFEDMVHPGKWNFLDCARQKASADDICHMSSKYVLRAIDHANLPSNAPKFLATDGHNQGDTDRLKGLGFVQYDNRVFDSHTQEAIFIDQLILMRGDLFIGNPISTLSVNVFSYRQAVGLVGINHSNYRHPCKSGRKLYYREG